MKCSDVQYHCKQQQRYADSSFLRAGDLATTQELCGPWRQVTNMGRTVTSSVNQQEIRYTIDESFR